MRYPITVHLTAPEIEELLLLIAPYAQDADAWSVFTGRPLEAPDATGILGRSRWNALTLAEANLSRAIHGHEAASARRRRRNRGPR